MGRITFTGSPYEALDCDVIAVSMSVETARSIPALDERAGSKHVDYQIRRVIPEIKDSLVKGTAIVIPDDRKTIIVILITENNHDLADTETVERGYAILEKAMARLPGKNLVCMQPIGISTYGLSLRKSISIAHNSLRKVGFSTIITTYGNTELPLILMQMMRFSVNQSLGDYLELDAQGTVELDDMIMLSWAKSTHSAVRLQSEYGVYEVELIRAAIDGVFAHDAGFITTRDYTVELTARIIHKVAEKPKTTHYHVAKTPEITDLLS